MAKSPCSSPLPSQNVTTATVSKPPADNSSSIVNNNAVAVKNVAAPADDEPTAAAALTNGKSSPPQVNGGVAPARHDVNGGSNKNLTAEIDIPPGTYRRGRFSVFVGSAFGKLVILADLRRGGGENVPICFYYF